ncbi:MAG: flavin reductase family protein [Candidatus Cloacimonadota bacterium]|nr:flavin reductase family protein [candidate division WOR-3 bacterium]TET77513.1 MAG: flavin reductase family protein [Candidatus Cloacimonadota bacterium]
MKTDVEYLEFMWPMRHFLITCGDMKGNSNIIAVSFCMPVSKEPPLIACAIGKGAYSCKLIESTKEFIVNVPPEELKPKIYYCGFHSGYQVDKFKETGLTPQPARKVRVPIIDECVAHMECKVRQEIETGDKNLFIGEVIEAYADEALVKGERKIKYAKGDFPRKVYTTRFKVS